MEGNINGFIVYQFGVHESIEKRQSIYMYVQLVCCMYIHVYTNLGMMSRARFIYMYMYVDSVSFQGGV